MRLGAVAFVLIAATPFAGSDDAAAVRVMQAREALVAVTARTAALLCPGVEVDELAIRDRKAMAGITDHDLMSPDRFGSDDEAAARSFKQSVADDPAFCGKMLIELADRLRLVRRR